jgi:hypothetical protein
MEGGDNQTTLDQTTIPGGTEQFSTSLRYNNQDLKRLMHSLEKRSPARATNSGFPSVEGSFGTPGDEGYTAIWNYDNAP